MVTHHNSLTGHGSYAGLKIGVLDGSLPLVLTLRISCGLIPLVVGILFTGFAGQTILAQGRTETILMTGQPAPDGNGIISAVFDGAINDYGQVVVPATLSGTSDFRGLFLGDGGPVTQIARQGQAAPDGNGIFDSFGSSPSLNNSGQVLFSSLLNGSSGGDSDDRGLYLGHGGINNASTTQGRSLLMRLYENPVVEPSMVMGCTTPTLQEHLRTYSAWVMLLREIPLLLCTGWGKMTWGK